MAKPITHYILARPNYGRDFRVIAVTSTKGRQVYGRDEHDAATHVSERDVLYEFPDGTTLEFANAARKRADAEAERHIVGITQARAELSRLEDVRQRAILNAAKGVYTEGGDRRIAPGTCDGRIGHVAGNSGYDMP